MGLIDRMKKKIKETGTSKKDVFYVGADAKKRIRFLQEFDTGFEFTFHNNWNEGIFALCLEHTGGDCPYCNSDDENLKTNTMYAWSVYDYDSNKVEILLYKATGITPVPAFIEFFDEYGTIMDRDYTIKKVGKGTSGNITVLPGERTKFRNSKVKAYNEKQVIKLLSAAYPCSPTDTDDEDEDEEVEVKKSKRTKTKKKKSLQDMVLELEFDEIKEIAYGLGMTKKEVRAVEDEEELVDILFEDYDEEDIQEKYDEVTVPFDEDDDED